MRAAAIITVERQGQAASYADVAVLEHSRFGLAPAIRRVRWQLERPDMPMCWRSRTGATVRRAVSQFRSQAQSPCEHSWMVTPSEAVERRGTRIGDAERDDCMEALTEHHVRGRLPVDELDRRHRAALTAETDAELAALLADLPGHRSGRNQLAIGGDWWDLEPTVRAARVARWAATPVSLVAGGVLVASIDIQTDETGFAAGLGAATLGYLAHLFVNRWSDKDR